LFICLKSGYSIIPSRI